MKFSERDEHAKEKNVMLIDMQLILKNSLSFSSCKAEFDTRTMESVTFLPRA